MSRGRSFRLFLVNLDSRIQLILVGTFVGLVCGIAAVGLTFSLKFLAGQLNGIQNRWIFFLLPAAGIVVTVLFLKYVARDFSGHGIPEVIYSVGMRGGKLKFRSSYSRLVGSLLTLASGASAGPEAPVVISGAAIGSNIATFLKTNDKIRISIVGSGAAAAIAAIFNAPLTGIVFTMEVILGEWTAMNLLPVAISSAAGTLISHLLKGNQIPFRHVQLKIGLSDIFAAAGLAFVCALCAVAMIKAMKITGLLIKGKIRNDLAAALAGGLLVGAVAFFFVEVRGEGYEFIREMISGDFQRHIWIVLLLIGFKILATALTIESGGAGGIFAPSLLLGSLSGLFYFKGISNLFPAAAFAGPGLFSLVGMAGVLSGTLQAPLTGIFLIFEITRDYGAILPLLIVSFLAATLVRLVEKHSIYHEDLIKKGLLRRPRTDLRILSDLRVEELIEKDVISVYPEMTLKELIPVIQRSKRNYFPVEERESGKLVGMITFHNLKPYLFSPELLPTIIVEELMNTDLTTVSLTDSMVDILKKFDRSESWSLPVVKDGRFQGLISKATLLDHYRKELIAQTET